MIYTILRQKSEPKNPMPDYRHHIHMTESQDRRNLSGNGWTTIKVRISAFTFKIKYIQLWPLIKKLSNFKYSRGFFCNWAEVVWLKFGGLQTRKQYQSPLHILPSLRTFWFMEKIALSKIRVKGTVRLTQLQFVLHISFVLDYYWPFWGLLRCWKCILRSVFIKTYLFWQLQLVSA